MHRLKMLKVKAIWAGQLCLMFLALKYLIRGEPAILRRFAITLRPEQTRLIFHRNAVCRPNEGKSRSTSTFQAHALESEESPHNSYLGWPNKQKCNCRANELNASSWNKRNIRWLQLSYRPSPIRSSWWTCRWSCLYNKQVKEQRQWRKNITAPHTWECPATKHLTRSLHPHETWLEKPWRSQTPI